MPFPVANIVWKDRVELGVEGLTVYLNNGESMELTANVHADFGRDSKELSEEWRALGDIKPAATIGVSGSYLLWYVLQLGANVTHIVDYEGSAKGQLASLSLATGFPLSEQILLFTHGSAHLATQDYLKSYYGVSTDQAMAHGFNVYEPKAGVYKYDNLLGAQFQLTERWSAMFGMQNSWLVGDAANSPLVERKHTISGLATAIYSF